MSAGVAGLLALGLLIFGVGFVAGIAYGVSRGQAEALERVRRLQRYRDVENGSGL